MSTASPTEMNKNGKQKRKILEESKHSLGLLGEEVRLDIKSPMTGAAIAGAAVVGAALLFGVPEALLGAIAGVCVYRTLKSRQAPPSAAAPGR